jgi:hypothetical protein
MQQVYLTRRNLQTLLNKLDRTAKGDLSHCSIVKYDRVHPEYPCSDIIRVTAVEDEVYYVDREPGKMLEKDVPRGRG